MKSLVYHELELYRTRKRKAVYEPSIDEDECPPSELFVQEELPLDHTLETYFDTIRDSITNHDELWSKQQLRELGQTINQLKQGRVVSKVPFDDLQQLMPLLIQQIQHGTTIELDDLNDKTVLDHVSSCIDAMNVILIIMSTEGVSPEFILEETAEIVLQLYKRFLSSVFVPGLDDKRIQRLVPTFCETMERLADFLATIMIQDRLILQCTSASLCVFELDSANLMLQLSSIRILSAIFMKYSQHRELLLQDLLNMLIKLPTTKRTLRLFKLYDSKETIQVITALILSLLQSSQTLTESRNLSRYFVSGFLQKCWDKKATEFRVQLTNFTQDLLVIFTRPEWPAAETILTVLSASLASILGKHQQKKNLEYSLLALDLLGRICSSIRLPADSDLKENDLIRQHQAHLESDGTFTYHDVLRHALLAYLSKRARQDPLQLNARHYLLLVSMEESSTNLSEFWSSKHENILSGAEPDPPQTELARAICMELAMTRPLCHRFDRFLAHIMALLNQGQPTFRARVMKALHSIMDADPMLMGNDDIKSAVLRCFMDGGASVRQAAVDLVGRYLILQPELIERYYDMVAERVRDRSVSVRKCVVKILRDLLLRHKKQSRPSESLCKLVERVADPEEESTTKDIILQTFQQVWFGVAAHETTTPSRRKSVTFSSPTPSSRRRQSFASPKTPAVVVPACSIIDDTTIEEEVCTIIDVVYQVENVDWFVTLIKRLLEQKKHRTSLHKRLEDLVNGVMECILQVEEGKPLDGLVMKKNQDQVLACLKALSVFGRSCPKLVVPHIETLSVYLKGDDRMDKATETQVLSLAAGLLSQLFPHMKESSSVSRRTIETMEKDLKSLVYKSSPNVVSPALACLAAAVEHGHSNPSLLFQILESFYSYLVQNPAEQSSSSFQRAAFSAGLILRHLNLDTYDVGHEGPNVPPHRLEKSKIVESLFNLYLKYISANPSVKCLVKGLGFMFLCHPKYLLQAHESKILDQLLQTSALETIVNLSNVLCEEQNRLERITTVAITSAKQVAGDQEGEATVIGGIMQAQLARILRLCMDKDTNLRVESLKLVGLLLTQGLISPLVCVPTLVALETDHEVRIREESHHQLMILVEKYPNVLHSHAMNGILLSHRFQLRTFEAIRVVNPSDSSCLFGRLYTVALRQPRQKRETFLRSLIGLYEEKSSLFDFKANNTGRSIDCLCYLTQILAQLPYDVYEEPLYLIYLINRYVSLTASGLLSELKPNLEHVSPAIQHKCLLALSIGLLLRLKHYLKARYRLDDSRCQMYNPSAATAEESAISTVANDVILTLPNFAEMMATPDDQYQYQYDFLASAVSDDQVAVDFDPVSSARKKKQRRKSIKTVDQLNEI